MASLIDRAKELFKNLESKAGKAIQMAQPYVPQLISAGARIPLPLAQYVVPKVQQHFATPYAQQQIYQPIKQGLQSTFGANRTLLERGTGLLQTGMGAFSATPAGVGFNIGLGATAGALRSIRTQQPLLSSVQQGIVQPTSLGTQGLGIQNPWVAMGVDVLAGNPKAIAKVGGGGIAKKLIGKPGVPQQVGQATSKKGLELPNLFSDPFKSNLRELSF